MNKIKHYKKDYKEKLQRKITKKIIEKKIVEKKIVEKKYTWYNTHVIEEMQ